MGVVDLAMDAAGRPVAIKRLELRGSAQDLARARQRIRREAEALQTLAHPNVVPLLEVIDDGDEVVLVMPYLAGGTLADQVRAHGPLSPDQVRALAGPLLAALAAAHRQGIVHRDIKPANVLFDLDGTPYLADFGVASLRGATSGLTATGMVVGTPEFMAPEQARGETVTPAADVFSLGATLAYALTGEPPYGRGDPLVLVHRAARGRVASLPGAVPADLRRLLTPMLDRVARRRPTAAAALGGPAGTGVLGGAARRRVPVGMVAGAVVGGVLTLGGLVALGARDDGRPTPVAAPGPATSAPSTTAPCEDQPYRPCGQQPAPFTDGVHCTDEHDDYDADPVNGCEAAPRLAGTTRLERTVAANLVPGTRIDRYTVHVDDNLDLLCDGTLRITLTAPAGGAMRVDVLRDTTILGSATSSDARSATVTLREPSCLGDDTGELTARVSWTGDRRTAADYRLERAGSF